MLYISKIGQHKLFSDSANKSVIAYVLIAVSFLLIAGCGSSNSSSGANAQTDVSAGLVGVYSGTEKISLTPTDNPDGAQRDERMATVTVQQNGQVSVRSATTRNSTSGSGQLREDNTFTLIADARTQFNGSCESGTLYLDGTVTSNQVTGQYRSENLICGGLAYHFSGELTAGR